jgi:hypothetical protein
LKAATKILLVNLCAVGGIIIGPVDDMLKGAPRPYG